MSYILDALKKAAEQRDRHVPVLKRLLGPAPTPSSDASTASGSACGSPAARAGDPRSARRPAARDACPATDVAQPRRAETRGADLLGRAGEADDLRQRT